MSQSNSDTGVRIEIISVGDELTAGFYPDLNGGTMARHLRAMGLRVRAFHVVGDGAGELEGMLRALGQQCDVLLVSGGLGPTEDDRTRSEAARAAGCELFLREDTLAEIRAWFERHGRRYSPSNDRQAYFPRGAEVLANTDGTAPGFALRIARARCFFLPGPPHEMERMLTGAVLAELRELPRGVIATRRLRCFGISEAVLGQRIRRHLEARPGRLGGITVHHGIHTITLSVEGTEEAAAQAAVDRWEAELAAELDDVLYGRGEATLQGALVELLRERRLHIALAESCTGGLVARMITDVPGASEIFDEGIVAYADKVKMKLLGVRAATLRAHGAVSGETALEMAAGAQRAAGADLALATTGIAGPGGGSADKPVGLVWFGLAQGGRSWAWKRVMVPRGRKAIRELAARVALHLALRTLQGRPPRAGIEGSGKTQGDQ